MTRVPPNPHTDHSPALTSAQVGRRAVLAGGVGFAALGLAACSTPTTPTSQVEERKLETRADDELPPETSAEVTAGPPLVTGSFPSARMRRETRWAVARPTGVTGKLPVVVVLHALNTNEKSIFSSKLEIQSVLQRYVDAGNPPFAIAAADGARNYYHPRADGTDAAAMVLDEFIPMLAADRDLNLSTERLGLFGWSMGGYGALRLATILGPQRVAAVAVSSPAMWADPRNYPPRAFDSLDDYRKYSLFGAQSAFSKIPLLINIGSSDQFYTYTRQWAAGLHPPAAFGTAAGGHTNRYWRSVLPEQVEFLGRNLTR